MSPVGLRADGVGEVMSVVRDGRPGLSTYQCGRRQGALGTQSYCESLDHSVEGRTHGAGGVSPNARDSILTSCRGRAVLF